MAQPVPQLTTQFLHVHEVQRGNPVLNLIKNTKWMFSREIVPDYVMSSTCALFLSVKYHYRHPKHILRRIDEVGRNYRLRVLLVLVDDENNMAALTELNRIAFVNNYTLIYAWSNLEIARYLETFKNYENKAPTIIQSKEETEFLPRMNQVLTNVRSINKTDVSTLLDVFGNLTNICTATEQQLVLCPGIGEKKVKRLYQALHEPFEKKTKKDGTSSSAYYDRPSPPQQQPTLDEAFELQSRQNLEPMEVEVDITRDQAPSAAATEEPPKQQQRQERIEISLLDD